MSRPEHRETPGDLIMHADSPYQLVAALVLAGCAPNAGRVTGKYVTVSGRASHYWLSLRADGGQKGDREVPLAAWNACEVGDRYPDCARAGA